MTKENSNVNSTNQSECCTINLDETAVATAENHQEHGDGHDHDHGEGDRLYYLLAGISLVLLLSGLALEYIFNVPQFKGWFKIVWYSLAYLPVGYPVLKEAWKSVRSGSLFTEFFLMSIATIGAFAIGEYPEGVAVMLFYSIGELFQTAAVNRAKKNIRSLLDLRPEFASVLRGETYTEVAPETVQIGEKIQIKVGERVPLDGRLLSKTARLNTAALTGESVPVSLSNNEDVFAGSINMDQVIEIEVTKEYDDSSIARIVALVQEASSRKSKTELLIRRLAKIYTPIVVYLAIAIVIIPYFFVNDYDFSTWLYRALIFLVISCPCALVISIPLGYFGGLGAASKNAILFKGATFLDQITKLTTVVMDKTGTVTKGVFSIQQIMTVAPWSESDFMAYVLALEAVSTHPIAKALSEYSGSIDQKKVANVEEISGKGLRGFIEGQEVLAGNKKLMEQFHINVPAALDEIVDTIVLVSINGDYAGYITIADELKVEAVASIQSIRKMGVKQIVMLSGDKDSITQSVAASLDIDLAKGGLLPEDKLHEVEKMKMEPKSVIAFVGDGINDAPVLAASDIGIAMGKMGSDVAIETADIIIQTDQLSKIALAMKIGKSTQHIIYQNITLAFTVKIIVLILGAFGLATMWQAVFADVGVAFLAILNAIRIQRMY